MYPLPMYRAMQPIPVMPIRPMYMPRPPMPMQMPMPQTIAPASKIDQFIQATDKVLKTAQSYGPYLQQATPLFKNLPALYRLYKGFKQAPATTQTTKTKVPSNRPTQKQPSSLPNYTQKPSIPKMYQPPYFS